MIRNARAYSRHIQQFFLFPFCCALALLSFSALPGEQPPAHPKLVIVISVDQMRADYLTRFRDLYSAKGFIRLAREGAYFANCDYAHVPTITAPGHSIILSGIMPGTNGIISNEWYSLSRRHSVYCVEDTTVHGIGIDSLNPAGRMSPRNFHGSTVGDQLRAASPSSKVIGISTKDRAAILLTGNHPTSAFWFDADRGSWITSSYYCSELPEWVKTYNGRRVPDSYLGKEWTKLLVDSAYARSGRDSARGEGIIPGESAPIFPHRATDLSLPQFSHLLKEGRHRFDALLNTPYGIEVTLDFARTAAQAEQLGMRGVTDLLAINLSSTDYCGHTFGPNSHEVEDMYLRLDRLLGAFGDWVDSTWGMKNVITVLTADHGVAPLPEQAPAPARRVNPTDFVGTVKRALGEKYGYDEEKENLILTFSNDYFYLDSARVHQHGIPIDEFEQAISAAALRNLSIAACYTRASLEGKKDSDSAGNQYLNKVQNGFNRERSGHVAVVLKEYCLFSGGSSGTSHGTGYPYDTHVPLLIAGQGVRSVISNEQCTPNDIAPTLCAILGVDPPQKGAGHILRKVMSRQ